MFKRLYVDNYKSLVNFELPLDELTLLFGLNGVGKTSILEVIFALRQLLVGGARITDPHVFPQRTLTRWQRRDIQTIEVSLDLDGDSFSYRIEIEHYRKEKKSRIRLERLLTDRGPLFSYDKGEVQLYNDDHSKGPCFSFNNGKWPESVLASIGPTTNNNRLTNFLRFIEQVVVCGIDPTSFKTESSTEDIFLEKNASNFAAWYRHLLQEQQDLVPEFVESIRDIIPGLKGIRLERIGLDTRALIAKFEKNGTPYELRLDEISDGDRALTVLYSLIHLTKGQRYTLFLDEPDNFVALPEIQPWLIELSNCCGEDFPQAILCSHHPELIDYFGGDRGLLLDCENSGVTRARKLEEIGELAIDHTSLRLSEIVARGWIP